MTGVFMQDARFAARTLRRAPMVAAAAIVTLGLGVGLNTAIFSVVHAVLVNQLPYHDPAALVAVTFDSSDPRGRVPVWMTYEWSRRSRTIQRFAAYDDSQLLLRDGGRTDVLRGMRVSAEFFEMLGVDPALGRTLRPEDDRVPRANVLVLTDSLWRRRFGGDPAVIGRTLDIDGQQPCRVIGVLRADFRALRMSNPAEIPQYFALLAIDPGGGGAQRVIARLAPGTSAGAARAELQAITRELMRESEGSQPRDVPIRVDALLDRLIGPVRAALWVLFGAVTLVLLMACANVASLQLVRAASRAREFAVRASLGGSRARIATQLLVENLLIGAIGGGLGLAIGRAGIAAIVRWAPKELPRLDEVQMDGRVLLFTLSITVLTAILFGLAPAWSASRTDVNDVLKRTAGVAGHSAGRRLRDALVVLDVALAFMLVMATGLLGQSYHNLLTLDAGFDSRGVLTLTPVIGLSARYSSATGRLDYYHRLVERVESVPGVTAAGMVSNVPLSNIEPSRVRTGADAALTEAEIPTADLFVVEGHYFRALGIPLLRGRLLTERDGAADAGAIVVSESFAARRLGGFDAIGQRVHLDGLNAWAHVVGVVGDVRYAALERGPGEAVYLPQAMYPFHYTRLIVRTNGDPNAFESAILSAIRELDPNQGIFHVQPMDDYVNSSLAGRRFPLALIGLFGTLALLLSAVGIYGVVSHSVVVRTPEIGLRAALGASRAHLLSLVLRQGLALTAAGLAAGLLAGLVASRLLASLVFGVGAMDAMTLGTTAAILAAVCVLGTALPARAATRIDPLSALRTE
jgi:putative ABC transport system permease protein